MKRNLPVWFTVIMSVLAVVGWTLHWHLTVNNSPVRALTVQQDGYLSVAQCSAVQAGTDEDAIVAEYGLPHDDTYDNGSTDMLLAYPLTDDHNKSCTIFFGLLHHRVYDVALDLIDQGDRPG